jgi:hypothetical protein
MKPNSPGIWEWFEENGIKRLVEVVDISCGSKPCLRVYWWGGYYSIEDEVNQITDRNGKPKEFVSKAQWTNRFGNRVANNNSVPEELVYVRPTKEQYDIIMEKK